MKLIFFRKTFNVLFTHVKKNKQSVNVMNNRYNVVRGCSTQQHPLLSNLLTPWFNVKIIY